MKSIYTDILMITVYRVIKHLSIYYEFIIFSVLSDVYALVKTNGG